MPEPLGPWRYAEAITVASDDGVTEGIGDKSVRQTTDGITSMTYFWGGEPVLTQIIGCAGPTMENFPNVPPEYYNNTPKPGFPYYSPFSYPSPCASTGLNFSQRNTGVFEQSSAMMAKELEERMDQSKEKLLVGVGEGILVSSAIAGVIFGAVAARKRLMDELSLYAKDALKFQPIIPPASISGAIS